MCGGGGIGKVVSGIGKAVGGAISSVGKAVGSVMKSPAFAMIAPIALNFMMPGIGTAITGAMGLSGGILGGAISGATLSSALGAAAVSGGMNILGGKSVGQSLRGAAIAGLTAGAIQGVSNAFSSGNPLSSLFSGSEGGAANNPLTAGSMGSTNLTGAGSGLGTDTSTLSTQFGAAPSGSSGVGLNPNAMHGPAGINTNFTPTMGGGIRDPLSGMTAQGLRNASGTASSPGFLNSLKEGNFLDAGKAAFKGVSDLMPKSTTGKALLGVGALSLLGGGGPQAPEGGGTPPPLDPSFSQRLQQQNFNWNPANPQRNLGVYGQRIGSRSAQSFGIDPATGLPMTQQDPNAFATQQGESQFFSPTTTPVAAAARGGLIHAMADDGGYITVPGRNAYGNYRMGGGLAMMAEGGMPMDSMDDMEMEGGDEEQLESGSFVVPARAVSALGEGSSEAGEELLEGMVDRLLESVESSESDEPMGALAQMAPGGMVSGEGSGVSDDIHASIDGEQEARLSSGEFVIPRVAVEALGGTAKKGAAILQRMVDQLNRLGHRSDDIARNTNASDLLPA